MTSGAGHILVPAPPAKPSAHKRMKAILVPDAADFILIGDSLAAAWPDDLLAAARPGRRILNLGLPGDRIQNTLWRIEQVPLAHLRPRQILVILGTNNLSDGDAPGAIAAGLAALLHRLDALWGRPDIILATIPPRGGGLAARESERHELNLLIARMASDRLRLFPTEQALVAAGREAFAEDGLHLTRTGYARLGAALAGLAADG